MILVLLTLLSLTGCSATEVPASQSEPEEELEEGMWEIVISGDDFSSRIGTLPYRESRFFGGLDRIKPGLSSSRVNSSMFLFAGVTVRMQ